MCSELFLGNLPVELGQREGIIQGDIAFNIFLKFGFILSCGREAKGEDYSYCPWATLVNKIIEIYKEILITVIENNITNENYGTESFLHYIYRNKCVYNFLNRQSDEGFYINSIDRYNIDSATTIEDLKNVCNSKSYQNRTYSKTSDTGQEEECNGGKLIQESYIIASMLSQIVNPCLKGQKIEILPLTICTYKEYIDNVGIDVNNYDPDFGALTLENSICYNPGGHSIDGGFPHYTCIKSKSNESTKKYEHFFYDYLFDGKDGITKFDDLLPSKKEEINGGLLTILPSVKNHCSFNMNETDEEKEWLEMDDEKYIEEWNQVKVLVKYNSNRPIFVNHISSSNPGLDEEDYELVNSIYETYNATDMYMISRGCIRIENKYRDKLDKITQQNIPDFVVEKMDSFINDSSSNIQKMYVMVPTEKIPGLDLRYYSVLDRLEEVDEAFKNMILNEHQWAYFLKDKNQIIFENTEQKKQLIEEYIEYMKSIGSVDAENYDFGYIFDRYLVTINLEYLINFLSS